MSKYLYHYTGRSSGCLILRTHELRLTPFTQLNDPKEVVEWTSYVAGQQMSIQRGFYKVLCFSQESKIFHRSYPGSDLEMEPAFHKHPLDSGWAKGNMWAHYAGNFDGLCLVFEKDKLNSCFLRQFDRHQDKPVNYSNDLQSFSDAQASEPNEQHIIDYLLFSKFEWWSNEDEYRFVVKGASENGHLFVNYEDALVGVIIGEKFPFDCRSEVYALAESGLTVYDLTNSNGMPSLSRHNPKKRLEGYLKTKNEGRA